MMLNARVMVGKRLDKLWPAVRLCVQDIRDRVMCASVLFVYKKYIISPMCGMIMVGML